MSVRLVPCRQCGGHACIVVRNDVSIGCADGCGVRFVGANSEDVERAWNEANAIRIPVGVAIRIARDLCGVGQVELSLTAGVAQGQVSKIENGKAVPVDGFTDRVAVALGVSPETLHTLADPASTDAQIGRAIRTLAAARRAP